VTRVCFIGDSHLAAVKGGWDAVAHEYSGIEANFFAAPSRDFANTAVENGRLVPTSERAKSYFRRTSGGQEIVTLADYDAIVLVGLGFSLGTILDIYAAYRNDDQHNPDGDFQFVSNAYFIEVAKSRFSRGTACAYRSHMLRELQPAKAEIWIYPKPFPCPSALDYESPPRNDLEGRRLHGLKQAVKWQDDESLDVAFSAARAALEREGLVIFQQPPDTRTSNIFTRQEFSNHSPSLTGLNVPENDYSHMNAGYGAVVVRQILDRLRNGA
jgi:hypothetical protein